MGYRLLAAWIALVAFLPLSAQNRNRGRVHNSHSVAVQGNLHFGTLVSGTGGGTLVMNSGGGRSTTGTVVALAQAPTATVGGVTISLNGQLIAGFPNNFGRWVADYYLWLGTGTACTATAKANDPDFAAIPLGAPPAYTFPLLTLNRVGGGATMTVQVATPAFHLTNLIGTTTDPYTSPSFPVVGTLNVGANKLAGTYTANLSVPYNDGVGANTTTLTVTAVVIGPITIANTQALHFGTAVRGTVAGTIVLTPAGVRSSTGGVTLMTGAPLATPASFTVTGNANSTFAITLPASAPLTSGANSLNASAFTSTPSLTGTLSAGGTQSLAVGGTLNVAANQAEGDYAGTFNVTVAYN